MTATPDQWCLCPESGEPCRVLETDTLWGEAVCRVWFPRSGRLERIRADLLQPLGAIAAWTTARVTYIAAAARIAEAMAQDLLLAPIEAPVIPLPHQLHALARAVAGDRVRYLLADEVGLGKTIEAGLILRELKLRGRAQRILIVAPKGLTVQWASEMRLHFHEHFPVAAPEDVATLARWQAAATSGRPEPAAPTGGNPWRMLDQVIVPMDSVKPLEKRRGWTRTEVADYNRQRFEDLLAAGWDLIIIDEAHRMGGSTDQVARFRLGRGLAEAAPYLLLLSATPHQGKTDGFRRLLTLLDAQVFSDAESVTRASVEPYVIRSAKRTATDAEGKALFRARHTSILPVAWEGRHRGQRLLYEAVSAYVRDGYNQAVQEKRNYVGFLMVLMQRLVTSSTLAIRAALEKRLEILNAPEAQLNFLEAFDLDEWTDLDGQSQLDTMIQARFRVLKNEHDEVKLLLEAARRVERDGPDAKAEALLSLIYKLQQEEGDPELKVLIFTEFVPTQSMLGTFLEERGLSVVMINGTMDVDERVQAQRQFAGPVRILVSTDAGGEGLNLQFCHVIVNYDLPWNPMKIEQRIGRVDRIGQPHAVRAVNFALSDTVEFRVREVLETKLAVILEEFGVDKTGDVLDSAEAGELFDELLVETIRAPDAAERKVAHLVERVRTQAQERGEANALLSTSTMVDPTLARSLAQHPLPHWVEQMTINYLETHRGRAEHKGRSWHLTWPDGEVTGPVVFHAKDALAVPTAQQLTLESPRIRGLVEQLPQHVQGAPLPHLLVRDLPASVRGHWCLWRIELQAGRSVRKRTLAIFRHEDGRILQPAARHIWDQLLAGQFDVADGTGGGLSVEQYALLRQAASEQGEGMYQELLRAHREQLGQREDRTAKGFSARQRVIERIGLAAVKTRRLQDLELEKRKWAADLEAMRQALPGLSPIVIALAEGTTT